MSQIIINRITGYSNKLRKIKLILDDKEVGQIKDGEQITVPIAPGHHKLQANIDWCYSNEVEFNISEGETKTWNLRGTNPLFAIYYVFFGRNNYLKIEQPK